MILTSINSVQQAYVSKHMIFKKFFWSTFFGTVVSGIVGIVMAYQGFGIWSLVGQYLTNTTIDTLVLQIVLNKWPAKVFSWKRLKSLLNYGYKILLMNLTITGYQQLRGLIIGKIYSSNDLAFYDKGNQFPNLIVTNINASISAVLFPKLAEEQDKKDRVKYITRLSVKFSAYIMSPLMLGLAAVAHPFVSVILTDKWLKCVPLMQILCVFYLFQPIQTANTQAVKALGRSDLALKLEIIRDIIQLVSIICVMRISVTAIVISMAVLSVLFVFINGYPNIKLIGYTFKEQISDFIRPLLMSIIMMICVLLIGNLNINKILLLGIQVVVGGSIYAFLSIITKNSEFKYFVNLLSNMINNK